MGNLGQHNWSYAPQKKHEGTAIAIYIARLIAAGLQLSVVFFLAYQSAETLGVYSLFTAIIAVAFQVISFEGHQYAIARIIKVPDLRKILATTNLAWIPFILMMVILAHFEPIAMTFIASFALNQSIEWIANTRWLEERIIGLEAKYRQAVLRKIVIVDILLPIILIATLYNISEKYGIYFAGVLVFVNIVLLATFVGMPTRLRDFKFPTLTFLQGVIIKRLDSMFIRLFIGFIFGTHALGIIQPLLSWGRILTMLTPTWINLNFSVYLRDSGKSKSKMRSLLRVVAFSYVVYIAVAVAIWYVARYINLGGYELWQVALVMIFFGNQNSKALLRSFSIIQNDLSRNNRLISIAFVSKLILCIALQSFGAFGVILVSIIIDIIIIAFNIVMTKINSE